MIACSLFFNQQAFIVACHEKAIIQETQAAKKTIQYLHTLPKDMLDTIAEYLGPITEYDLDPVTQKYHETWKPEHLQLLKNHTMPYFSDKNEAKKHVEKRKETLRLHYCHKILRQAYTNREMQNIETKEFDACMQSFLYQACDGAYIYKSKHNLEIAALALACGAQVNKADRQFQHMHDFIEKTPFQKTMDNQFFIMSKFLLHQGAWPKNDFRSQRYPYRFSQCPLEEAIKEDSVVKTKYFIDAKKEYLSISPVATAEKHNAHKVQEYLKSIHYTFDEPTSENFELIHKKMKLRQSLENGD